MTHWTHCKHLYQWSSLINSLPHPYNESSFSRLDALRATFDADDRRFAERSLQYKSNKKAAVLIGTSYAVDVLHLYKT